jgi:hypothetical protein
LLAERGKVAHRAARMGGGSSRGMVESGDSAIPYWRQKYAYTYSFGPVWWTYIGRSSKVEELGRVEVGTCLLGILFGEEVWLRR